MHLHLVKKITSVQSHLVTGDHLSVVTHSDGDHLSAVTLSDVVYLRAGTLSDGDHLSAVTLSGGRSPQCSHT